MLMALLCGNLRQHIIGQPWRQADDGIGHGNFVIHGQKMDRAQRGIGDAGQ
jgi:hypothetical protein